MGDNSEQERVDDRVPAGFRLIDQSRNPFILRCGPLYGRVDDGKFVLGMRIREQHCNPAMMCHGGMIMTLADMTMLIGSNVQTGVHRYLLTVNLTTDFLAPAPLGEWIEGRVQVMRKTRNMIFAQGALSVGSDAVARINGIFKPVGEEIKRFSGDNLFDRQPD